ESLSNRVVGHTPTLDDSGALRIRGARAIQPSARVGRFGAVDQILLVRFPFSLVPKLRLGTRFPETPFRAPGETEFLVDAFPNRVWERGKEKAKANPGGAVFFVRFTPVLVLPCR